MFLGLDLGTSGLKAIVISNEDNIVAQTSVPLTVKHTQPLWSEQDPHDWWQAVQRAVITLRDQCRLDEVRAIGVAGQMHGATLLDNKGRVLRPCILWNDGRSFEECDILEAGLSDFRQRCGNRAMPGFTSPKLLWLKRNEPAVFKQIAMVLLPKDYLVYRLTGQFSSDMSDASGTLWLNPQKRAWDQDLVEASGLGINQLPEVVEGTDVVGRVHAHVAMELGLPKARVVAGAGDNAAGAIGAGVVNPGESFVSLGTSGVYFVASEQHRPAPENTLHAFCHCLPNLWHQMSVSLCAAGSLAWLSKQLGASESALIAELEHSGRTQSAVTFLPYLNGERTPHNNPRASGMFFGLRSDTDRIDLTLAVLEGVAFSFADGQRVIEKANGIIDSVSLIGGGARSHVWGQILANVLNKTLHLRDGVTSGPGFGAARLAQLGTSASGLPASVATHCSKPALLKTLKPHCDGSAYYGRKLAIYRQLYVQTCEFNEGGEYT